MNDGKVCVVCFNATMGCALLARCAALCLSQQTPILRPCSLPRYLHTDLCSRAYCCAVCCTCLLHRLFTLHSRGASYPGKPSSRLRNAVWLLTLPSASDSHRNPLKTTRVLNPELSLEELCLTVKQTSRPATRFTREDYGSHSTCSTPPRHRYSAPRSFWSRYTAELTLATAIPCRQLGAEP